MKDDLNNFWKIFTTIEGLGIGITGFFLSLIFNENLSPRLAIASLVSTVCCVIFIAPSIIAFWSFNDPYKGIVYFFCGLVGMNFVKAVMNLSNRITSDPISFIKAFFPSFKYEKKDERKDS